ncbi:CGNR zinc finger domain-containing protein [Brevibacterium paucivorans]|uniref:CGNR zinc finger domain-containing protein n=1 Tax=Brevibacterium paucivorans TaxID=170994 RepID=UPI00321AC85C
MPLHVPQLPIQLVVELINEWATTPQEVSTRPWNGYPAPDSAPRRKLMDIWPSSIIEPDDRSIAHACDDVYPIFTAPWPYATANHLNNAIVDTRLSPRADAGDDTVHLHWSIEHPDQLMSAILVASLLGHVNQAPQNRFGTCESTTCADVLVDQSPTHTKHFCSPRCQTRERVRAHRSRATD